MLDLSRGFGSEQVLPLHTMSVKSYIRDLLNDPVLVSVSLHDIDIIQ